MTMDRRGGPAYLLTHRPEAMVAVLVVATPCPLILATPVAIISGINRVARRDIIVKSGAALEQISGVTMGAFGKTGTVIAGGARAGAGWHRIGRTRAAGRRGNSPTTR